MAKPRVYELAAELRLESKAIMDKLKEMGEFVRSASSTIEPAVARRLREEFADAKGLEASTVGTQVKFIPARTLPQGTQAKGKVVTLQGLSSDAHVDAVINAGRQALQSNAESLTLDMSEATGFYPSATVPVAAILQHFRSAGLRTAMSGSPRLLEKMSVRNPIEASQLNISENDALSRVWVYFDHQQVNNITNAYMDSIRRRVVCETGVLEALEWCLYEVLDNVMQHARADQGYVMMQLHPHSHRLAIAIADTGQGVQRSLATSETYRPRTAFDALTLAVEEGVTRDKVSNQGNGLFGLFRIIQLNNGRLILRSGRGRMRWQGGRINGDNQQVVVGPNNHGTFVDFQLAVDKPVSMKEALNYQHANFFLEELEDDDRGCHVVKIREHAGGAGTRPAAKELRIFIENVTSSGAQIVELDFSGQAVVSSSFADEVIGKLIATLGFTSFNRKYRLTNMNDTVAGLIDTAIAKRLGSSSLPGRPLST